MKEYDPFTKQWSKKNKSPYLFLNYSGIVRIPKIPNYESGTFILGGLQNNLSSKIVLFHSLNEQFEVKSDMRSPRANMGCALSPDGVLVCGGRDGVKVLSTRELFRFS